MKEYEILIEYINPCGGEEHSRREFVEAFAESPGQYVKDHSGMPVTDISPLPDGGTVITTGDGNGYITKYTFSE